VRQGPPSNLFDYVVTDRLEDMVDTDFRFYKRITNDREFSRFFLDRLFERYWKTIEAAGGE